MVQKRDIALAIIFTLITCGIYGIYWFFKLNDDVNTFRQCPAEWFFCFQS